jgi:beta-galactosidase/beta-glucuronidase
MNDFEIIRDESLNPPIIIWCNNNEDLQLAEKFTRIDFSRFRNKRKFPIFLYRICDERLNRNNEWAPMYSYDIQESIDKDSLSYKYHLKQLKEEFEDIKSSYDLVECTPNDVREKLAEYFV